MRKAEYIPTEAEIERECQRIQADWSEARQHSRAGLPWPPETGYDREHHVHFESEKTDTD